MAQKHNEWYCLVCNHECGSKETPMHYVYATDRSSAGPFCTHDHAMQWLQQHPEFDPVRCAKCGDIIVNTPWYIRP